MDYLYLGACGALVWRDGSANTTRTLCNKSNRIHILLCGALCVRFHKGNDSINPAIFLRVL
jgi:hypothetical protein